MPKILLKPHVVVGMTSLFRTYRVPSLFEVFEEGLADREGGPLALVHDGQGCFGRCGFLLRKGPDLCCRRQRCDRSRRQSQECSSSGAARCGSFVGEEVGERPCGWQWRSRGSDAGAGAGPGGGGGGGSSRSVVELSGMSQSRYKKGRAPPWAGVPALALQPSHPSNNPQVTPANEPAAAAAAANSATAAQSRQLHRQLSNQLPTESIFLVLLANIGKL